MKEPHHRPSFQANTFSRFAKRQGVNITIEPVDPYGLVDSASLKEAKQFAVMLMKDFRAYSFAVVFDDYRTELPSIEDVLEYMANDAAIYERFGTDVKALAREAGLPLDQAARMIEHVQAIVPAFGLFLGSDAYEELLKITEDRG